MDTKIVRWNDLKSQIVAAGTHDVNDLGTLEIEACQFDLVTTLGSPELELRCVSRPGEKPSYVISEIRPHPAVRVDTLAERFTRKRKAIKLPSPVLEQLSTEIAQRGISPEDVRRLEVLGGPQSPQFEDSRNNFHVVKDSSSAYVILKTKEFIYDAMNKLTRRGLIFNGIAIASATAAVVVVWLGIRTASRSLESVDKLFSPPPGASSEAMKVLQAALPYHFTVAVIQILGISGLVLIVVKMLLAIARASVHEAIKNFERRHAMRFGWLYMELMGRDWKFDDLKEAFQWNRESSSAFREIDLRHVSETTLNLLLVRVNEILQSASLKAADRAGDAVGSSAKDNSGNAARSEE